jgi:hypothetical protein
MNEVNNPRTKINPTQCRTHINAITKMQTKTKQNQKKKQRTKMHSRSNLTQPSTQPQQTHCKLIMQDNGTEKQHQSSM